MSSFWAETPVDVLNSVIWNFMVLDRSIRRRRAKESKPGELIAALPPEKRALLANLRSEDISLQKLPRHSEWIGQEAYEAEKSYREDRLAFDKKMGQR